MKKSKRNYELEILEIVETKDWDRARRSNDENLYQYMYHHKNINKNCRIISEHIKPRDFKSEVSKIVETKDWDRARPCNDKNLYTYISNHKDTDKNCRIIWEHINIRKDYKSEILEIVETKDWDRAKRSNDFNLYRYIYRHRNIDKNCETILEHIGFTGYKSEISEIIETEDWKRAYCSNNNNLYQYIKRHKDEDKNCGIIWEHITIKRHCPYTIKDYLLNYFKHGKLENRPLYNWFAKKIKKESQCCIDIKNLIVAADTYKDPVALETLELIKSHLEKEGT